MPEDIKGWSAPLYQGLAEPMLWLGVPPTFLLLDAMGSMVGVLFLWQAPVVGVALYAGMARLTAWEPQWWKMLWSYRRYASHYEG